MINIYIIYNIYIYIYIYAKFTGFLATPHRHPQTMSVRLLAFIWLGTQHTQAQKRHPNNTPPFPRTSHLGVIGFIPNRRYPPHLIGSSHSESTKSSRAFGATVRHHENMGERVHLMVDDG